ncbi:MAG: DNA polymerase III subunit chi [Deltaproteobacteria bacterium]|nr:DNA polymerase III subunit chi [Deltaproteobacteria bacterium]
MARVTFYDIAPDQVFALAAKLAQAAWDKDKRLIIRCADAHEAKALDDHLWTFRDESFVPHEVFGGALRDPRARIVITTRDERPIEADILLQLAPAELAFATGFDTVIDLVDHADEARLAASRQRFRAWSEAGTRPDVKSKA